MADEIAIRKALAANLAAITGWQTSPFYISNPSPPTGMIVSGEIEFDKAFARGSDVRLFNVIALVGTPSDEGAGRNLAELRDGSGPRSIKEKLEADPSLGGACDDLIVRSVGPERPYAFEGQGPYLGCEFRVEVHAQGN